MSTNDAGKNPQDASYLAMFQSFLVNKSDSPPADYMSESDDAKTSPLPQSSITIKKEHASGSEKVRPIEVVKPFISEMGVEDTTIPKIVAVESLKPESTKKKKKIKKKGKKVVKKKVVAPPLRTSARRKAKEQTNNKIAESLGEDDNLEGLESDFDLGDSDADPAWCMENSDDEGNRRRGSRRKRHVPTPSITSESEDEPLVKQPKLILKTEGKKTEPVASKAKEQKVPVTPKPTKSTNVSCEGNISASNGATLGTDFKAGEFVVMKEDLDKEYPPIWRLDGKTLLQKYEPFKKDGEMLYRNLTTFSGWTTLSRPRFLQAPVKFRVQNRKEIVVEFTQDQLTLDDLDCADDTSKDLEGVQENFEVYIQTLISQVLDTKFLPEIFQEKDEYFLSNLKAIDDLADKRKSCLVALCRWKEAALKAVSTWPYFKITPNATAHKSKMCAACETTPAFALMDLDGDPYDEATLELRTADADLSQHLLLCVVCSDRMQLYHKVAHQKYLLFIECNKEVFVKKGNAGSNMTTILNDMLTDETWLAQAIASIQQPLKAIDKLDLLSMRKVVAEKYRLNKPAKI